MNRRAAHRAPQPADYLGLWVALVLWVVGIALLSAASMTVAVIVLAIAVFLCIGVLAG